MMRTSTSQIEILVDFMERNGDLCKPNSGPRGRLRTMTLWDELAVLLNSDGTGERRPVEKWRKVWTDYKNNIKKKAARINRAACGTGGGPSLHVALTELELRVLGIMGVETAIGLPVEEAGFMTEESGDNAIRQRSPSPIYQVVVEQSPQLPSEEPSWEPEPGPSREPEPGPSRELEPGSSQRCTPAQAQPQCSQNSLPKTPKRSCPVSPGFSKRMKRTMPGEKAADAFLAAEREHLKILKWQMNIEEARIRQRDRELDLQENVVGLIRGIFDFIKGYFEGKKD